MKKLRFDLAIKTGNVSGSHLIIIRQNFKGHKIICSTKMSVSAVYWDKKLKRVIDCDETADNGDLLINERLDQLECYWHKAVRLETTGKKLNPAKLKANMRAAINRYKKTPINFEKQLATAQKERNELGATYLRSRAMRWGFSPEEIKENPEILLTIRELLKIKRLCKSKQR